MAKKKAAKQASKTTSLDTMLAMVAATEKKFGAGYTYGADAHKDTHIGVPLPSLALEHLFGANILYLGAMYGLAGAPKSFKSTFGLELLHIIAEASGACMRIDAEGGKVSASIIESIMGKLIDKLRMRSVTSVEDAQKLMTFLLDWATTNIGRDHPFGLLLDSISGSGSDERFKQIKKDGYASRDFPVEALLWSKWFQGWEPRLHSWPFAVIYVNHKKIDIGNPRGYRHPGGDAQDYYATIYIHASRVKTNETADWVIHDVQLQVVRHSFGVENHRINVPLRFNKAADTAQFDWGAADAILLMDDKIKTTVKDLITVTSDSTAVTALTRTFSCPQLELEHVTGVEFGKALHKNKKLLKSLRTALHVRMCATWGEHDPEPPAETLPDDIDTDLAFDGAVDDGGLDI